MSAAAWKIALTIVLGVAVLILNVWLYEHRLDPPETDRRAKFNEMHRYDATGRRLLPLALLADVLFIATFLWMTFEFR
ncbi:hypothetical protein [Longimicrobium sp.]|uniref:hypothetical protein n=1 Tax=Longimicrobium sp. TaxID=2029185 RepID=UPI003B3B6500